MTASAGIFPEIMTAIRDFIKAGELSQALYCQRLIERATRAMKRVFFPYGYRLAMQARGFDMGPYPVRLSRDCRKEYEQIAAAVQGALEAFSEVR